MSANHWKFGYRLYDSRNQKKWFCTVTPKTLPAPNAQLPALVVVASMLSHFLPEPHYLFSTFTKHSTVT
jgi:hypothetical protein